MTETLNRVASIPIYRGHCLFVISTSRDTYFATSQHICRPLTRTQDQGTFLDVVENLDSRLPGLAEEIQSSVLEANSSRLPRWALIPRGHATRSHRTSCTPFRFKHEEEVYLVWRTVVWKHTPADKLTFRIIEWTDWKDSNEKFIFERIPTDPSRSISKNPFIFFLHIYQKIFEKKSFFSLILLRNILWLIVSMPKLLKNYKQVLRMYMDYKNYQNKQICIIP